MALRDLSLTLKVPGRLVANPADLTVAFPYSGTELGTVRDIVVRPGRAFELIPEEAFGPEPIDALDLGESWVLTVGLRSLDPDALAKAFAATSTGPTSGKADVAYPGGTFRAGTLRSSSAIKLLFVPEDVNRHPMVYFPKALPLIDATAEIQLSLASEVVLAAQFIAVRDDSTPPRTALVRRKEDLTL